MSDDTPKCRKRKKLFLKFDIFTCPGCLPGSRWAQHLNYALQRRCGTSATRGLFVFSLRVILLVGMKVRTCGEKKDVKVGWVLAASFSPFSTFSTYIHSVLQYFDFQHFSTLTFSTLVHSYITLFEKQSTEVLKVMVQMY